MDATVSEVAIFKKLANPAKVQRSLQKHTAPTFAAAVHERLQTVSVVTQHQQIPPTTLQHTPQPLEEPAASHASAKNTHTEPPMQDDVQSQHEEQQPQKQQQQQQQHQQPFLPPQKQQLLHDGDADEMKTEILREKQGYLFELNKMEKQGVKLTRRYTMEDELEDVQFEFDRLRSNLDTINAVHFMRDGLKMGLQGLEIANNKFGPILELSNPDGESWAEEVSGDMQRYEHCLERLYKKHWRKGSMAPELELLMLLGGSMTMYHFQRKMGGGGKRAASAATKSPQPGGGGGMPWDFLSGAAANVKHTPQALAHTTTDISRPVMRRPNATAQEPPPQPASPPHQQQQQQQQQPPVHLNLPGASIMPGVHRLQGSSPPIVVPVRVPEQLRAQLQEGHGQDQESAREQRLKAREEEMARRLNQLEEQQARFFQMQEEQARRQDATVTKQQQQQQQQQQRRLGIRVPDLFERRG